MKNETRPQKQNASMQHSHSALVLKVSVFQHGICQCEKKFPLSGIKNFFFLSHNITIGPKKFATLSVPLAKLPMELKLFRTDGKTFSLYVDPRFRGFLSTAKGSGSLESFTLSAKSLRNANSVHEPFEKNLECNDFGIIKYSDFEILFKIEKKQNSFQAKKFSTFKYEKVETSKGLFAFATPISLLCVGIVSASFLFLSKNYSQQNVPFEKSRFEKNIVKNFVSPENIDILGWMVGTELDKSRALEQAFLVVTKLHLDWNLALASKQNLATVGDTKKQFHRDFLFGKRGAQENFEVWNQKIENSRTELWSRRNAQYNVEEASLFSNNVNFSVLLAGGFAGNLQERQNFLFEKLKTAHKAILDMENSRLQYVTSTQPDNSAFEKNLVERNVWKEALKSNLRPHHTAFLKYNSNEKPRPEVVVSVATGIGIKSLWTASDFQPDLSLAAISRETKVARREIVPPPQPKPIPSLDTEDLDLLVLAKNEQLKNCYEILLSSKPEAKGTIMWTWTIALNGQLRNVALRNKGLTDKNFERCLIARVRSWKFPKPKNGDVTLNYPMKFSPIKKGEAPN